MWISYRFSQFVDINPVVKLKQGEKYSFVEMKDIDGKIRYCDSLQERMLSGGSRFADGDTLFARITPCLENGKIAQVRNLKNGIGFGSTEFLVFRGKKDISDSDFIFYLSKWDEVRDFAEINLEGTSGRQRVNKDCFSSLKLSLPPLAEQKAIAAVLGSLDDKIDLLHRQNATLERMAETLFRQWFIEEVQEDWEECCLENIVSIYRGASPRPIIKYVKNGTIPWIKIADATATSSPFIFSTNEFIIEDGIKKSFEVYPDDLILSNSATCGLPFFVAIYGCVHDGWLIFRNFKKLPKEYIFLFLRQISKNLNQIADGSVQNNLNTTLLKNYKIRIPPEYKIDLFNKHIPQYINKIKLNQQQIRTLEKLRDTLLPKLMSGEARVRVAE